MRSDKAQSDYAGLWGNTGFCWTGACVVQACEMDKHTDVSKNLTHLEHCLYKSGRLNMAETDSFCYNAIKL